MTALDVNRHVAQDLLKQTKGNAHMAISSHKKVSMIRSEQWDIVLPQIPAPEILINGGEDGSGDFSLPELVGAIQQGDVSVERIRNYLSFYPINIINSCINKSLEGYPAIFYVVETRSPELIRLWARFGGDVNVTSTNRLPLLAFAIALGVSFKKDTTDVFATLLSLGSNPTVIPAAFCSPLARDLPVDGPPVSEMPELGEMGFSWCTPTVRSVLAARMNFRQRYYMFLAKMIKPTPVRLRQITRIKDADNLLAVPFFLIGQTMAAQFLIKRLVSVLAKPSKVPLVMIFAGPSGHGKTELARKLGELMSLDMEIVDCSNKKVEWEMFGARNPYDGHEKGSPLNNFLSVNNAQKSVVFLDEFEKTTDDIRKALLLPFQNGKLTTCTSHKRGETNLEYVNKFCVGEYEDRRNRQPIDSSRTIWILATNAFDETIHQFCKTHQEIIFNLEKQEENQKLLKGLCNTLRKESIGKFGAPLTGRITDFIPFLTFSEVEQAAVAHKCMAEVGKELAKPVVITPGRENQRFIGDIHLQAVQDYSICRVIAKEEYVEQLGARSLIEGVKRK